MMVGRTNGKHQGGTFARAVAAATLALLCASTASAQNLQGRRLRLAIETFRRAQEFQSQGKLEEAIAEYRRALRQNQDEAYWRSALAEALEAKGDLSGALEELRRASELSPDDCGLTRRLRALAQDLNAPDPPNPDACVWPQAAIPVSNPQTDFVAPVPLARVDPEPVDKAWLARHGGTAVLRIFVDAEGTVVAPEVVKPLGLGLDQEALRAVRRWKFRPASRNGVPVASTVLVEITFAQFAGQR